MRRNVPAWMGLPAWAGSVATLIALAATRPAGALINPKYTPVDLVRQSEVILRLELGEPDAGGRLAVAAVEAIQGKAPAKLELVLDESLAADGKEQPARLPYRKGMKLPALVFTGDFSQASASDAPEGDDKPVGILHVDLPVKADDETRWFALFARPRGGFRIATDKLNMKAVWAGGNEMLRRAVAYILADPRADVPVAVGVKWAGDARLGRVAGPVHGAMAVDPDGAGRAALLVLAVSGDRLFGPAGPTDQAGKMEDLTEKLKLVTRSLCAAWGDFDGDGRLDLASWDGKALAIACRRADGTFDAHPSGVQLAGGCLSLAAMDAGGPPRACLLAGTDGPPLLLIASKDGTFAAKPLAKYAGDDLGEAGPCAVADFDGDSLPDVLQPCAKGVLFYKGKGGNDFDPPAVAARSGPGQRPATPVIGDFDADGLLDAIAAGGGPCVLRNLGGGKFLATLEEAGEVAYTSQRIADGACGMDINHDGRLDVLLTRANTAPLFYFNRGFACFGAASALELEESGLNCHEPAKKGQQAAAAADFDGDGATDVAIVTLDGEVWLLRRHGNPTPLGLTVSLPPGCAGPVTVVASDGKHSLGARVLSPGTLALFGKPAKGPLDLQWRLPGRAAQTARAVVVKPMHMVLPAAAQ